MRPLEDLLHRIQWDPTFRTGVFALGYYDRVAHSERIVPFTAVTLDRSRPDTFSLQDEDGLIAHIPLHRVRTVYRNGIAIWQRPERHGKQR
jgi:uncharacterized protein (UPF0248 family)